MNLTNLEKQTYNALIDLCMDQSDADVKDLADFTGLEKSTLKGAVGSLVKKGMAEVGEESRDFKNFKTINPIINGFSMSFGCDEYDEAEAETFKL